MARNNHKHITRRDAENEIKEAFGFVPDFYGTLPDVAFGPAWLLDHDLEMSETVLDNKTKELIGLAVAAQIKCSYCTYFHTRAAQTFGASEQELREAVAMGGLTALLSNSLNGLRYDFDKFRKEVERGVEYMGKHQR